MLAKPLLTHDAELHVSPAAGAAEQAGHSQHARKRGSGNTDRSGPIHGKQELCRKGSVGGNRSKDAKATIRE